MNVRTMVVMLVVAVLAVVLMLYARDQDDSRSDGALPASLLRFDPRSVAELELSAQGESVHVRRDPADSESWQLLLETTAVRADAARIEDFANLLTQVHVHERYDRAEVGPQDYAGFGLAEPSGTVKITVPGEVLELRFGKPTLFRDQFYAESHDGEYVWVVSRDAYDELVTLLADGVRSNRITPLGSLDVKQLEVSQRGVTTHQVLRNEQQVWVVRQPYRGFAHPSRFERTLARIVNALAVEFVDDDVQTPSRYGLDEPEWVVTLTPRREAEEPEVLLVSKPGEDGTAFVMEEGGTAVVRAGAEFVEALAGDAREYRDPNFTRLGLDGVALRVRLDGKAYELVKEGESWDITEPVRDPADNQLVEALMDDLRAWAAIEFHDLATPESKGIDGEDVVELERRSGELIKLLLGDPVPGRVDEEGRPTAYYAQREDAGGRYAVVTVPIGPLRTVLDGYAQFRSKTARVWNPTELRFIGRQVAADANRNLTLERDFNGTRALPWRLGAGYDGELDPIALAPLLNLLKQVRVVDWVPSTLEHREAVGIEDENKPSVLRFEVGFEDEAFPTPPNGVIQVLLVGEPTGEDAYHARFAGDKTWAFTLPKGFVDALMRPLRKNTGPNGGTDGESGDEGTEDDTAGDETDE